MSVWSVIESSPAAGAALGWHQWLGPDFGAAAAFCLRETTRQAERVPCPRACGCGHRVVPVRNGRAPIGDSQGKGRFIGVCDCEEPDCEDLHLGPADLVVWEVDLAKLGRAVARAFSLYARDGDCGVPGVVEVGALGGTGLSVLLTVQPDAARMHRVVAELVAQQKGRFVLLAPTGLFLNARARSLLASVGAGFFDLASQVDVMASGLLVAREKAGALSAALAPKKGKELGSGEAARVFELMKLLEMEPTKHKAPLISVFRLLVLEGRTQRQAAARCKCVESLITARVATIEDRFKMSIERLRSYATALTELETAVKGDRRRKKSAGRPDDFDQPEPAGREDDDGDREQEDGETDDEGGQGGRNTVAEED
jgi:hypothetical protein